MQSAVKRTLATATCKVTPLLLLLIVTLSTPEPIPAAELKIDYAALRTFLLEKIFTDNGRYYLAGDPTSLCNYALLENPRVSEHDGRLQVTTYFRGRTAVEISGSCVGPGQAFDVSMTGVPVYKDGTLRLDDVQVQPTERLYSGLIRAFLGDTLVQSLRYPLFLEVQELARQASARANYDIRVPRLSVDAIRVQPEAIVFFFDFTMEVK